MGHMIISAIVHGLIYRLIWSITRGMGIGGIFAFAIVGIGGMWAARAVMGGRRRNSRRRRQEW
jgi:hypothetical protein